MAIKAIGLAEGITRMLSGEEVRVLIPSHTGATRWTEKETATLNELLEGVECFADITEQAPAFVTNIDIDELRAVFKTEERK